MNAEQYNFKSWGFIRLRELNDRYLALHQEIFYPLSMNLNKPTNSDRHLQLINWVLIASDVHPFVIRINKF